MSPGDPSVFLYGFRESLYEDEELHLNCKALGLPLPDMKWLKNGLELKDGDLNGTVSIFKWSTVGGRGSDLRVFRVERQHAGNYTCQAQNKYNTRRQSITVSVSCEFYTLYFILLKKNILQDFKGTFSFYLFGGAIKVKRIYSNFFLCME